MQEFTLTVQDQQELIEAMIGVMMATAFVLTLQVVITVYGLRLFILALERWMRPVLDRYVFVKLDRLLDRLLPTAMGGAK